MTRDDDPIDLNEASDAAREEAERDSTVDENDDIEAAIDEAVQAVEDAARRRERSAAVEVSRAVQSEEVEVLQSEVNALRDRLLRTLADFDNFRKRVEREREEQRRYAASEILRDVLGIVDNLERALTAEGGLDDLKQGVEMIQRQMEDTLRRAGVERVEATGELFDPSVHEAVSRVEDPEVADATVLEEFQSGYLLHDRLLRPSIVRVAVPVGGEGPSSTESAEAGAEVDSEDPEPDSSGPESGEAAG